MTFDFYDNDYRMPPRRQPTNDLGPNTPNGRGGNDQPDAVYRMLERINDTLMALEQRLGAFPPQAQVPPPPPPAQAPPPPPPFPVVPPPAEYDPYQVEFMALLRQFQHLQAPMFTGDVTTPIEAVNWLRQIEKNFECINCPEPLKVRIIRFYLRDDADHWWDTVKLKYAPGHQFAWEEFYREFEAQYFPQHSREDMIQEFMEFKQEGMTVAGYAFKFRRLLRYAGHTVPTEANRISKFMKGLRPSLRVLVEAVSYQTLSELIAAAERVERTSQEVESVQERMPKTAVTHSGPSRKGKEKARGSVRSVNPPKCSRCGKFHFGECRLYSGKVFKDLEM